MLFPLVLTLWLLPAATAWGGPEDDYLVAIKRHDMSAIQKLIAQGTPVDLATENGKTALMAAAGMGETAMVEDLLEAGAQANATNDNGGTALMYASVKGQTAIIELLLSHAAQVNTVASNGWTAVMLATVKGHADSVILLIENGANANLPDIYGASPLMKAIEGGRVQVIEVLLESDRVNLDAKDDRGITALHLAAARGNAGVVHALLARGVDAAIEDGEGRTASIIAQSMGHGQIVEMIDAGQ